MRAKAALACLPVAFVLCVIISWAGADIVRPEVSDPDYLARRDLLRERLSEQPAARLMVVLGSSRTGLGFVPEAVPHPPADGRPTLWFNLSHYGAGPAFHLVTLDRMHRDGIRPDTAVIELTPPFVTRESERYVGMHLSARELAFAVGYLPPGPTAWQWFRHRFVAVRNVKQAFEPLAAIEPPGRFGGPPKLFDDVTTDERTERTRIEHGRHGPAMRDMTVPAGADRAVRDGLARCRERGITPILLLAPEGKAFRCGYDPDGLMRFECYLADVAREHGVKLIDARDWLADTDFADGHHPLRRGAVAFTQRLVREVRPNLSDR